jgi:hypothetical protein
MGISLLTGFLFKFFVNFLISEHFCLKSHEEFEAGVYVTQGSFKSFIPNIDLFISMHVIKEAT